ncbi:DegT/DnrJ/EryC1/StrS family aminotransferase [bacterium (Candidatus Blackallbacteria) CG17_big_fil_post_rev_8_21_14_2_50_48_46]|uniref:DegT/DnrJ/EryC1/StrS family aminotransferase n=1 Tax=bacterium (Candidatus Blackallbacteria) CG17_big_fil_post_rev_8_21_14_2_50_48_46 TaxID=2014261 RepID=A0A2M7GAG4_9BACT|nr:MAG: aminotransferase DegT [bacterium (Candidatus Blackallbacteria) CG18_big_fil_WC_8_21_14_2_50_49_26]PIW19084.1 MAG: DegT/DnrJ/EryC1/StrS family aminotransferase [bacterium (Candidatus Blackallbacteria) CG17_big_fil_post_rev_8_21_14_2_50_48_46]PIW44549.1 MAG: DegT/DnrJ/EryC1/StrS family aminotransferase [bacterium (Candidatus Blackallbacteria) CG13_big_fil_rev_8_21_14_2_50_49_14]
MKVPFSYLDRQFSDLDAYFSDLKAFVKTGDFTLGKPLSEFENSFAKLCQAPHAIGVGSGTDALILPMQLLGIGPGDEVITTTMTFHATVGAIAMTGATPVFVDSEDGYVIDASKIEAAITPRTKALLPVHYTGNMADMPTIMEIAKRHHLHVVEDSCQSIAATLNGKPAGHWGAAAAFSVHPLKNLNVWGDGGLVVTHDAEMDRKMRLFRNHGMVNRDEIAMFGHNSRLDTLQAVIGNRLIQEVDWITEKRVANATFYDQALAELSDFIEIPKRRPEVRHVFHLYIVRAQKRDELLRFLNERGVEAKIHYPIPVHLQEAARHLGYKQGDFPVAEAHSNAVITLPAHQHLSQDELAYTVEQVKAFYQR